MAAPPCFMPTEGANDFDVDVAKKKGPYKEPCIVTVDSTRRHEQSERRGLNPVGATIARIRAIEAPPGFEPGNGGFADLCLTTWLRRRTGKVGGVGGGRQVGYELWAMGYGLFRYSS